MKKTLLILGAGASKDIYRYFPTGLELVKDINSHLTIEKKSYSNSGDDNHLSDLTNQILVGLPKCKVEDIQLLKHHLWNYVRHHEYKYLRFEHGIPISIDNFIHENIKSKILNEKSKAIAQYAISYLLIGCEEAIKYILNNTPNLINENWVSTLNKKLSIYSMTEINEKLSVISFNYERTFAHLFAEYKSASLSDNNIFYKSINYIYGSLGEIDKIPFGLKNDSKVLMRNVFKSFQLIDNERDPIDWDNRNTFDKIIFLGFGYDKTNLNNLNIKVFPKALKIGTGKNLDNKFKLDLKNGFGIEIFPGTCTELIEKHIE